MFYNKSVEIYVSGGSALIRRGSDIYVNEPHVSGGVPILSKTDEGVRYHKHDFLGTTLWSMDTKGGSAVFIEGASPLRRCYSQNYCPRLYKRNTGNTYKNSSRCYASGIFGEGDGSNSSERHSRRVLIHNLQQVYFILRV